MPTRARPLQDRIVVKRDDPIKESQGGIVLPESLQEIPQRGTVLDVGPGVTDNNGNIIPMTIAVGDRIVFGSYAGTEIEVDDDTYVIMREQDVAAVVDGDEKDVTIEVGVTRRRTGGVHEYYQM